MGQTTGPLVRAVSLFALTIKFSTLMIPLIVFVA